MEKLFLVLALLMVFSFPAVANDNMSYADTQDQVTQLEDGSEKLYSRCYAKPRAFGYRGYTYIGSGINRWTASRSALRNCHFGLRRVNYWAARYGCYISHCFNFLKEAEAQ